MPESPQAPAPPPDAEPVLGHHPPERLRWIDRLRVLCTFSTLGLIALGVAWELWLAPLQGGTGALALKVLPLCFALRGLVRHRLYTYRWLSLLVWLYFTEGVVRVSGDGGLSAWLAAAELLLSVTLFAGVAVYVRLRLKVLPPKAASGPAEHQ